MTEFEPLVKAACEKIPNTRRETWQRELSSSGIHGNTSELGVSSLRDGGAQWAHARRVALCPGARFAPCSGCLPRGFLWSSGRWSSGPVPACSCLTSLLCFWATSQEPILSKIWPRASCSSSRREGRRVKRVGSDPRTGFFRHPLHVRRSGVPLRVFSPSFSSALPSSLAETAR